MLWLHAQLTAAHENRVPWVWVAFHHPAYSQGWSTCNYDGEPAVREHLVPVMEQYGVTAVFNGHMHGYERGTLNGVHYVTTGGGGGALDRHCQDWPHIEVAAYEHHFVTVDVDGAEASLKAHRRNGTLLDTLEISARHR
ncbi:MAG: metallophosphoesterase [Deltaproteobacteria bacterium]|jgi:hypothetical protein|nr:metallophosphoesterase [Deltaproteobacteria bacterium]MBW2535792.1 metallophosphoesterase [Deltaproteobacteria bacterium]